VDGSAFVQPILAASLPLPTGAATEATLGTRLAETTFTGRINTLGQKTGANSTPVVLASDTALPTGANTIGNVTVGIGTMQLDAFGRLRASEPVTLFDGKLLYDSNPLTWDTLLVGTGAVGTVGTTGMLPMTVTATNDKVVRQSRRYSMYQPGKSQLNLWTGILGAGVVNVRTRFGVFDSTTDKTAVGTDVGGNGYFFQQDGTALSVVRRSYVSGSQVDTAIPQASWNVDPLNGTGPSGITLNPANINIFFLDMEWLGAGSVRMGIVYNGQFYIAHIFNHANLITTMHTQTASLPIRYEVERTAGSGAYTAHQGCATAISEGGHNPRGQIFGQLRTASISCAAGSWTPLISIRPAISKSRTSILPLHVDTFTTSNQAYAIALIHGVGTYAPVTLTGVSWATPATDSLAQYDVTATAATGGRIVATALSSSVQREVTLEVTDEYLLAASITGQPDTLTVAAQGLGGSAICYGAITWREYF
jgi:hypothetical protein